ncbi:glycosyltransferase family 39 protein [Hymenobacter caeli]|uniref:Glycosyltransferase RgtA/B/C/D-like domain-containing protein n=1 Tax=Hymenobacter caeli TaxID=2735894 RepID=A0ABX2FRZ3_9BACT|nr:glycosyltransferase family 39 protein [Hymenobacter caeli]NRT19239.1 hypothetical protein [Hymenobacter caeli]
MTTDRIRASFAPATKTQRLVVGAFFTGLLLLGLWLVRDYGVSVDEGQSRMNGMVSLKYLGDRYFPEFIRTHGEFAAYAGLPLPQYYDRDYGVVFELPVTWLEQALGLTSWRDIFQLRHLCTFLVCLAGVGAVYRLARRRFSDWRLGLLAALLLVLSPRLFADSFYNDKDAVFMGLFAVATNTAVAFVARPTWRRMGWHALACALTIDVRIMGVVLPLATLALLGLQAGRGAYRGQRVAAPAAAYLPLLAGLVVALWPYLWAAPWVNFAQAFANMAKFRWNSDVLYAGRLIPAVALPWHYAPVWIAITTPVLYLVGWAVGAAAILRRLGYRRWQLYAGDEWQDLLFLGLTVAPVAAVVLLHSVIYDGWRQLYFVYPSLLLVALRGLVAVARWRPAAPRWQRAWQPLCYGVLGASLLTTAVQMVTMHPLQNTYFNLLPGRHLEERYELDYWVLSYRQGLEWIARHDDRAHVKVAAQMPTVLESNRRMLSDYDQDRLEVVTDGQQADYYLTTYRWHPYPYTEYPQEVAALRAGGQRVLSIFRVRW